MLQLVTESTVMWDQTVPTLVTSAPTTAVSAPMSVPIIPATDATLGMVNCYKGEYDIFRDIFKFCIRSWKYENFLQTGFLVKT